MRIRYDACMSRKPTTSPSANLSPKQMQEAISKIDRRIADLNAFDPDAINDRSDASIKALEQKLDALLTGIFGHGTVEYSRYKLAVTDIDRAPYSAYGTPITVVREGLRQGVSTSLATLAAIKEGFLEELADAGIGGTPASKALKAYEGLDLHPEIERAAGQLYRDAHYANAIEDSVKALNAFVRLRSGVSDRDGTALMEYVFSPRSPILKFNPMSDQSDIDEQKGFMMMFAGAVAGLRNPRAHRLMKDDPERALEFIAFVSLLAKLTDAATK